ncbi:hypothetical protein HF1_08060 [Mycoplasma haemofelis str. Langford 1]|uniref:Uncharacterized protein n=1 Tax=Mycoplasma haemofelis (strain Langford 1) TaxID=941640 RepID=E8ZI43_MYCHL|nr:hypothetical protein [Mycoplasma haemofelis]CBY92814.1 hypothetical protein HF1_08060 [Mycoplasma haemofelis str. Langford 1]
MAILPTLIRFSPVVAAPTIGAGVLAVHFEGTKMEEIIPIEEIDYTPNTLPQRKKSLAFGREGRKYTSGNVQMSYSSGGNSGGCRIYALEDQEDNGTSLIFRFYTDYNDLQSAQRYINTKGGNIDRSNHIGCNKDQHVYIYRAYGNTWQFKVGNQAPVYQD